MFIVCEERHTIDNAVVQLSFLVERRSEKIVAKLFKEESGTYVLLFYFNVDATLKTPLARVEVLPKNQKDTWVFEEFASELLTERKED